MTSKERLHGLVDRLDDEQAENAIAYVERLIDGVDGEELSAEDLAAVSRGIEDIGAGLGHT